MIRTLGRLWLVALIVAMMAVFRPVVMQSTAPATHCVETITHASGLVDSKADGTDARLAHCTAQLAVLTDAGFEAVAPAPDHYWLTPRTVCKGYVPGAATPPPRPAPRSITA